MKIQEVIKFIEDFAPLEYQEEYDNSGLILGDLSENIKGINIALDCTEEVVDESILHGCNLIITHHPLIFNGLKKINGNSYVERVIIKAIKNNIAVYALHTNLDNIYNGVNAKISEKLGVKSCRILKPKRNLLRQLVVYCPLKYSDNLKKALYAVGAGNIGNYKNCSFTTTGKGTFQPLKKANPFIGKVGELHEEQEDRIEVIYSRHNEQKVLSAMYNNHPYEEISYKLFNLENTLKNVGAGMIGVLKQPMKSLDFLKFIKKVMKTDCIRYTSLVKEEIKSVAVCGGSGSFLLNEAIAANADIFISSDFKYHEFFNTQNNIIIADIGHYESEQFTKDLIYDLLTKKFTKFAIRLSKINTNPIKYLHAKK